MLIACDERGSRRKGDQVFKVERYAGFSQLPVKYAPLFRAAGETSIFLTESWFRNFVGTVAGANSGVTIYGVEDPAGVPVAALPTWRENRTGPAISPRRLRALSNYYTSFFGLVMASGGTDCDAICEALAQALWHDRGAWDVIDLRPVDSSSPWFAPMVRALQRNGMILQTYVCFGNWYLEVDQRPYAEYLSGLNSVLKNNIPRRTRQLMRSGGRIELITDAGDRLERGIRAYAKVYSASWKVAEPHPEFMPGLMRTAAAESWLRLGIAYVGDEPAAAQVWLVHCGTASIFKLAYDERFAKMSVGTVLTAHLMNHVISVDHVSTVDYLTGDDGYKRDWMSHRRERHGIFAINPRTLRGAAQVLRHVVVPGFRRSLQRAPAAIT